MKTTLEISDALLIKAKAIAKKRKVPLRLVVEEALLQLISQPLGKNRYKLPDKSIDGHGPAEDLIDANWGEWRKAAYGERE